MDELQRATSANTDASDALVKAAIVAALNSDDLIEADRRKAVAEIKEHYKQRKEAILGPLEPAGSERDPATSRTLGGVTGAELRELLEV